MLFDEQQLEELVIRAVRRALDERLATLEHDLLTKEQVAQLLSVTTRTVTTYMQREGLPHTKRGGRAEFKRSEVINWWRDFGKLPRLKVV